MKEVLIFAGESLETKEIVQCLIQKHFKITIFTFNKFHDVSAFVGMSPLQVNVVVLKIANYYNWKHELHKFDVIINLVKITDFPKENIRVVFENFTLAFGQAVKNLGKTVIYLSNVCNEFYYHKTVENAETAMLSQCDDIIYIKYGFVINSQSKLLTDLLNAKFLFLSSNVLNASMQIAMMCDISQTIAKIALNGSLKNLITIGAESYSLKDIINFTNAKKRKKFIVKIPHFLLMTFAKMLQILPQRFYYTFYNYKMLANAVYVSQNKFKFDATSSYTLLAKIVDRHSKNLFSSEIE